MRVDARMKQVFPTILAALITLVAYLQARGLAQLFAANIGDIVMVAPRALQEEVRDMTAWRERKADGSAILSRNVFDSVTGPLDSPEGPDSRVESLQQNHENPYADPACEAARVLLITTTEDPTWSFAAIAIGHERATLRRIGDGVGDRTVYAMTWDRVWMVKSGRRCQLELGREIASISGKPPKGNEIIDQPPLLVPPAIASKIIRITENRYDVDRTIIEAIMDKKDVLFRNLRVIPARDADGASMKLSGIKKSSLLDLLGLANGDKLQKINGFDMSDPLIAVQAYSRLLTADKLDVRIVRAGKPETIEINLR